MPWGGVGGRGQTWDVALKVEGAPSQAGVRIFWGRTGNVHGQVAGVAPPPPWVTGGSAPIVCPPGTVGMNCHREPISRSSPHPQAP